MISILKGVLAEKLPGVVVLECGGIGYHIKMPANTVAELPEIGEETMLYIQMIKTKTDISLPLYIVQSNTSLPGKIKSLTDQTHGTPGVSGFASIRFTSCDGAFFCRGFRITGPHASVKL